MSERLKDFESLQRRLHNIFYFETYNCVSTILPSFYQKCKAITKVKAILQLKVCQRICIKNTLLKILWCTYTDFLSNITYLSGWILAIVYDILIVTILCDSIYQIFIYNCFEFISNIHSHYQRILILMTEHVNFLSFV